MRHYAETELSGVLTLSEAIDALASAYAELGRGAATVQPRLTTLSGDVRLNTMAAALPGTGYCGAKVYTALGGRFSFVFVLFALQDGRCLATFDMAGLTALRTAAVSALAARHLARPTAQRLAVFGTGTQAAAHLAALCEVLPITGVDVVSRHDASAFVARMRERTRVDVRQATAAEAVPAADVVVTATRAAAPLFDGSLVPAGCHITAIGSARAEARELDAACIARCDRIVVEALDHARHEAGDLIQAAAAGVFSWDRAIPLSDLVLQKAKGRETAREITLFKSVGSALQDLALAARAYDTLQQAGG